MTAILTKSAIIIHDVSPEFAIYLLDLKIPILERYQALQDIVTEDGKLNSDKITAILNKCH